MARGAPKGNQNAAKSRLFGDAIRKAVMQDDGNRLRAIAEKLLDMASEGDIQAIRELADRMDGKPKQQTEFTGEDGKAITFQMILSE